MTAAGRSSGLVAATCLAAVVLAQPPLLPVLTDQVELVHAERVQIDTRFEVVLTKTERLHAFLPATGLGTADSPFELTEANEPAWREIRASRWTYTVLVREVDPGSVRSGRFVAELWIDGRRVDEIHLSQDVSDPLVQEGALLAFDLGGSRPVNPLFTITIRPFVPVGIRYHLRSVIDLQGEYRWRGVGGSIEGATNPDLTATVGTLVEFRAENGEGTAPHNLEVRDDTGAIVAQTPEDIELVGEISTFTWTPDEAGDYSYRCKYHPGSMVGDIAVGAPGGSS